MEFIVGPPSDKISQQAASRLTELRLILIYTAAANRSVDFLSRKQPMGASVTLRRFFHSRTLGRGATRGLLFWQGKGRPSRGSPSCIGIMPAQDAPGTGARQGGARKEKAAPREAARVNEVPE